MSQADVCPTPGNWRVLRPAGENFSVLVPEDGNKTIIPVPNGGEIVENHVYMGRDGCAVYTVMWMTGPTYGESDKGAVSATLESFLKGVGQGFQKGSESVGRPASFVCDLQNDINISQGGYTGSEFDLSSCTVPARARAFTRVVDDQRQMYLAFVFYMEEDENVARFTKSFTINSGQKARTRGR